MMNNLLLNRKRAKQLKALRGGLMIQLYPTRPIGTVDEQGNLLLSDLLSSFKRYAGNQQTAYDSGSVQTSSTSTVNQLERQVERAMTQVLGRSPGRGAANFFNALNAAFPKTKGGKLATLPSQSQMVLYSADGKSKELLGELSTQQAALYRQASIIMADALKIIERLSSFIPQADQERVEALRSLITSQIKVLVEEFRWMDEPRPARVEAYLSSLNDNVAEFGRQAFLNDAMLAVNINDEDQITQYELLKTYIQMLEQAWDKYYAGGRASHSSSLSERIDRARVLLPVLSQGKTDFSNALESVGLSESERRSRASRFSILATSPIEVERDPRTASNLSAWLPDITVSDLIDWLDRFANMEAPSTLDNAYGIDFVTDQADRLFWTIAPIVVHLKIWTPLNSSSRSTLEQILSNERVTWALDNLLTQLNELANLAG
ncbi:MAG: hypothetical protein SAK29_04775 [Scytonema sp. PMC 1069.18]|nr:hypothetical protein [Scytonema sp. PMC 1069.18]